MKSPHDTVSSIHLNHREAVTVDNNKFRHLDVCDFTFEKDLIEHPLFAAVHQ